MTLEAMDTQIIVFGRMQYEKNAQFTCIKDVSTLTGNMWPGAQLRLSDCGHNLSVKWTNIILLYIKSHS